MHKFKDAVRRGSALLGAAGLAASLGASAIPALVPAAVSADALNPLTQRSLTLSSSSPGWSYTDGSGNITYANPNSGANGKQTGNTFSFNVSSTKSVNAFTFQYCVFAAGACTDPGNDAVHGTDTTSTSDLKVVTSTPSEISSGTYTAINDKSSPGLRGNTCFAHDGTTKTTCEYTGTPATSGTDEYPGLPKMDNSEGNFVVLTGPVGSQVYDGGWTMTGVHQEEGTSTGNTNMITLVKTDAANANPTNGDALTGGEHIEVIFYGTATNYIQNPGASSFFVKINDYEIPVSGGAGSEAPVAPATDANPVTGSGNIIDGGVTVANVMNESIEIQTKVLETMQFSVGTVDPDTLTVAEMNNATGGSGGTGGSLGAHGACDNILPSITASGAHNVLYLGDPNDEHALSTSNTYGTHSYWRLSSNSSAGATVYYSGSTLHDTEGDSIKPIGSTAQAPQLGSEQFGLALDNDANIQDMTFTGPTPNGDNDHFGVNADNGQDTDISGGSYDFGEDNGTTENGALDTSSPGSTDWLKNGVQLNNGHNPQLFPLVAQAPYNLGGLQTGAVSLTNNSVFNPSLNSTPITGFPSGFGNGVTDFPTTPPEFAFDPNANTVPAPLATESSQVVDCVTGKMRYIANIAAITPAGIYTTKINYIAAPQY